MSSDRSQRINELFEKAAGVPAADRPALLQSLCDDADLRAEVAALLDCDDAAPADFLRPPEPIGSTCVNTHHDVLVGTHIGRFHIESVIGHGGMGTVYLATQESPCRKVAVKVMRPAFTTPQALRRFEFESKVLAHLRHPNIAHVYEAGVHRIPPSGLAAPYFAMEYIPDAQPITSYAAKQDLSLRQRLELFEQVCAAVHHGHQKGVIHRDLKPGNILVDAVGVPRVIDFGVARGTDADLAITTMQTDAGQLIGTLQYMSPEQCDADPVALDIRSDVYSLGVVLYQLMTGSLPYETFGTSIYTATKVIKESTPTRPSTIDRKLRGDLELVLLKALEKDRERRYATAADLARDIRHHLNGEPVEAKPPTGVTRVVNWTRRHPVGATSCAAAICGTLVLSSFFASVWYLGLRPDHIVIDAQRRAAVLVSSSGRPVHRWKTTVRDTTKVAQLVAVSENDSERLALVGFLPCAGDPRGGKLCAFDVDAGAYESPAWCHGIEVQDVPTEEPERDFKARDFSLEAILGVHDVFVEVPGLEIIASFGHGASRRALRVISSQTGEVLYQIWHDGWIASASWLSAPKRLVLAGANDEVPWNQRGGPTTSRRLGPWVVWAVEPQLRQRTDRYVCTGRFSDCVAPVFYRCVLPPEATDVFSSLRLEPPLDASVDDGSHFLLALVYDDATRAQNRASEAGWVVDASGVPMARMPYKHDSYLMNQRTARGIEDFYLDALPPIARTDP